MSSIKLLCAALAIVVGAESTADASIEIQAGDYVRMTDGAGGLGGVFYARETNSSTSNFFGDTFATFCVETAEHIGLPGTYYVRSLSTRTSETNKDLTPLAAWVFADFVDNKLPLFLTGFMPSHVGTAMYHNTVQMAIWRSIIGLTEAQAASFITDIPGPNYSSTWLNQLLNPANYAYSSSDFRGVQIMNLLTKPSGSKIQDQLVRNTPPPPPPPPPPPEEVIPEPAAFVVWGLLFGLTLSASRQRT
jgi:hypothetical protein